MIQVGELEMEEGWLGFEKKGGSRGGNLVGWYWGCGRLEGCGMVGSWRWYRVCLDLIKKGKVDERLTLAVVGVPEARAAVSSYELGEWIEAFTVNGLRRRKVAIRRLKNTHERKGAVENKNQKAFEQFDPSDTSEPRLQKHRL